MGTNDTLRGNLESINLSHTAPLHGDPGGVPFDPATEGKGCEKERTGTASQQFLAHMFFVSMTMGRHLGV